MFLELNKVNIGYKNPLIHCISNGLNLGEVCLLMGNNGIGKTTLIKSLLNQIPVLEGEILLNGENVSSLSAQQIAEKVAVVFSKAEIPTNYTTYDLISLGKYIHYPYYMSLNQKDKEEIENILQLLSLEKYRDTLLSEPSDGNLQKAFIGRALAQDSPMIILDEPTTHLDENNKIKILKILRELAKNQGKAILFSSHDWRLARYFVDKIWYIKNEKLYAGLTDDIIAQHKELQENPNYF